MMRGEIAIRVPARYRGVYDRARIKRKKYLEKGVDVSLFSIMNDLLKEEEELSKRFPGFRL